MQVALHHYRHMHLFIKKKKAHAWIFTKFVDQKRKSRLCSCLTINIYHPKDPKPNHKIKEANATNLKNHQNIENAEAA